jgi:hypothetical protein
MNNQIVSGAAKYTLQIVSELLFEGGKIGDNKPSQINVPYDNLEKAFRHLQWHDDNMFFYKTAWDNGYFCTFHHISIVDTQGKMILQKYATQMEIPPSFPMGVYLQIDKEAINVQSFKQATGFNLLQYESRSDTGNVFLVQSIKDLVLEAHASHHPDDL